MTIADFLHEARRILGTDRVLDDAFAISVYASDDTPKSCDPEGVVFPRSHDEVAGLVRLANRYDIPLVPRGGGSGNVGGALPVRGSVVVSFECMQGVLEQNAQDRYLVVQAGVYTWEIQRLAMEMGLFYPPDPGSAPYCRIGGNLAMNAAGPRAVKYGVTRDYVLGLRAVTGAGESIRTGVRTTKSVTGYDLTRLLVGSEGTLAMMTEVTLRLLPPPEEVATLRVCFQDSSSACQAVQAIMLLPFLPRALEFMDAKAVAALGAQAEKLPTGTRALLMIEVDGDREILDRQVTAVREALPEKGVIEVQAAKDPVAVAALWEARKGLSRAVKQIAPLKINEDVVVPVSRLAELVAFIESLGAEKNLPIVSFGHAGNGNLHVNIMVHPDDAEEMARARAALADLFAKVLALGGSLSGEHGLGTEKREFLGLEIDPVALRLMRQIKEQFDPRGILNPGKMFPG